MAVKGMSRLDANREVRRIFVRHGIDTTQIHFSCHGKSLMLTGSLFKDGGIELESQAISTVMEELGRIGVRVSCELENWTISDGSISKKGAKGESPEEKASKESKEKKPVANAPKTETK